MVKLSSRFSSGSIVIFLARHLINIMFITCVTYVWAAVYWLGGNEFWNKIENYKPFVYRQLIPILTRLLGFREDLATVIIVTLSGIGFYIALRELIYKYYEFSKKYEVVILGFFITGLLFFSYERKPYDLPTAFLFTLALLFIAKDQIRNYMILFPFICLNKETAWLLIVFSLVFAQYMNYPKAQRNWLALYQVFIYVGIMLGLHWYFADNPGVNAWVEPVKNLLRFIHNPAQTLLHLSVTTFLLFMACKDWYWKPALFRVALLVMGPPLVFGYFIFGQAFEVRVFWEIYPVIVALSFPVMVELIERKNNEKENYPRDYFVHNDDK